jgi:hypothetical protein
MSLEASYSPQEGLAHLVQIHGIEEEVFWIGRDVNLVNAVNGTAEQNLLRTERVRRAGWKSFEDLSDLSLRGRKRVEEGFPNSLHGCYAMAGPELRDRILILTSYYLVGNYGKDCFILVPVWGSPRESGRNLETEMTPSEPSKE